MCANTRNSSHQRPYRNLVSSAREPRGPQAPICAWPTPRNLSRELGVSAAPMGMGRSRSPPSARHLAGIAQWRRRRSKPPYWTHNVAERQILMSIFHLSEQLRPSISIFCAPHEHRSRGVSVRARHSRGFRSRARRPDSNARRVYERRAVYMHPCGQKSKKHSRRASLRYLWHDGILRPDPGMRARTNAPRSPNTAFSKSSMTMTILPRPTKKDDFVWTGFLNRSHASDPLLASATGAAGKVGGQCSCGRAFPLVVPTITRESDILHCPDGRLFSPRALNQLLKQSASLRFCQFVHDRPNRVVVRAVARGETRRNKRTDANSRGTSAPARAEHGSDRGIFRRAHCPLPAGKSR